MKRILSIIVAFLLIASVCVSVAFAVECAKQSTHASVTCWRWANVLWQYATAEQSAACAAGHDVAYETLLTVTYTDDTVDEYEGHNWLEVLVPAGKVGYMASAEFNTCCSHGVQFEPAYATDYWELPEEDEDN